MSKIRIMHLLQSDRFSGAENVVCHRLLQKWDAEEMEIFWMNWNLEVWFVRRNYAVIQLWDMSVPCRIRQVQL